MSRDRIEIMCELVGDFRLSQLTSAQSRRSGGHAVVLADIGAGQLTAVGLAIRGGGGTNASRYRRFSDAHTYSVCYVRVSPYDLNG